MAVPQKRKLTNIELSIQKHIKDNFETPFLAGQVNHHDATFDSSAMNQWVDLIFLSFEAGKKGASLLQVDIYSRVGGRRTGGDRLGMTLADLADKFHNALHVRNIQIYDFSTPASPTVIAKAKLIVRNSNGKFREPEDTQNFAAEDHVMRRAITYRFITLGEVSQASQYYD